MPQDTPLNQDSGNRFATGLPQVKTPLSELNLPPRQIVKDSLRVNDLTPKMSEALQDLVCWRSSEPIPVQEPLAPGRSIHLQTQDGTTFKVKGAVGIEFNSLNASGPWSAVRPRPSKPYSRAPGRHLHFSESTLEPSIIHGKAKSLYSLNAKNASSEFDNTKALSEHNLAFAPRMQGDFTEAGTGKRELDCHGQETGFYVGEFSSEWQTIDRFCSFLFDDMTHQPQLVVWNLPEGLTPDFSELLSVYEKCAVRIAQAKMRAIVDCGLTRHAGHMANFLGKGFDSEVTYLSDLDSSRLIAKDDPRRGVELFSSIGRDMWRSIYLLTFQAFSNRFLEYFTGSDNSFFEKLLGGYFRDFAEGSILKQQAWELKEASRVFLEVNQQPFRDLAAQARATLAFMPEQANLSSFLSSWHGLSQPLLAFCFRTVYHVMQNSQKLKTSGFKLPELEERSLADKVTRGLKLIT